MDGTVIPSGRDVASAFGPHALPPPAPSLDVPVRCARDVAALRRLRDALAVTPDGVVDGQRIAGLLAQAWPYLHGSFARGMCREKVAGHIEDLAWRSPVLSFRVARATWQVDVQDASAWIPVGAPLDLPEKQDAKELAEAIVQQVIDGRVSAAIVRKPQGVSIRPGEVPGLDVGYAETLPGRHRRFRAALEQAMAAAGYVRVAPYRFTSAVL